MNIFKKIWNFLIYDDSNWLLGDEEQTERWMDKMIKESNNNNS